MAKEAKGGKAAKTETKASAETFKYGVKDLAEKLDIDGASVRIKLRNAGVAKASNGSYGWNTKDELSAVIEKITAKKEKAADKEKPAKASTKKDAPAKDTKKAAEGKGAKKSGKKAA